MAWRRRKEYSQSDDRVSVSDLQLESRSHTGDSSDRDVRAVDERNRIGTTYPRRMVQNRESRRERFESCLTQHEKESNIDLAAVAKENASVRRYAKLRRAQVN